MTDEARDAIVARFDAGAAAYDESPMHRALATALAEFADLDDGGTVLDVGTGTGLVLRALAARRPESARRPLRLVGVDLSPAMLAVARAALPVAELVVADAASLPLAGSSVDLVTCATVLHLVPDAGAVLREWARVLRPGGRAVTATFGAQTDLVAHRHGDTPPYPSHPERFWTPELVGAAAAGTGLAVRRHAWWHHADETVLLAELAPVGG